MGWTTTDLLSRIRVQGRLASAQPDYTDAVLLDKSDSVTANRFVPAILAVRENYFARYLDRALVANQQAYAFPSRAFGSTLREVVYVGTNSSDTYRLREMPYYTRLADAGSTGPKPDAYVVEDDRILILPTPSVSSGTIRLCYEYRPGTLVATTAAMAITGITGIADGDLAGVPPATFTTGLVYDIIKANPPFALIGSDLVCTEVHAAVHLRLSGTLDTSRIAVGDYVAIANQTPIPQIPAELHNALAMAVAAEVLEELGDAQSAAMKETKVQIAIDTFQKAIARRVKAPIGKIVNVKSSIRSRIAGVGRTGVDDGLP